MSALDRLEKVAGIIIFKKLAPKFLEIATALHFHESTVDSLTLESNPVKGLKAVFEAWLSGYSPLPPTWESLIEIFHTVQMEQLAQNIQHFFNRTVVPSSSASQVGRVCLSLVSYNCDAQPISLASQISESKKEELELHLFAIENKNKPDCRDMAFQNSPDHQEVAVQKSPDHQDVGVQKSPDHLDVGVQKSPDHQDVGVQKSPDHLDMGVQKSPDHLDVAIQNSPDHLEMDSPDYKEVAVQTTVAVNSVGKPAASSFHQNRQKWY